MPPPNCLLGGVLLAGLALPAFGQGQLPVQGQPGNDAVTVDEVIRQTIAQSSYQAPPGPGFNLEGGVELLFLRPHFDDFSNGGISFGNQDVEPVVQGNDAPEYELEPAFRIWLAGVIDNGFGVRARFFHIDADSELLTGVFTQGLFTSTDTLATSLEMNVLDVEGTVQRAGCNWFVLAGAGVRYARLLRQADFTERNTFDGEFDDLFIEHFEGDFEGIGPTFALEGRRRLCGNVFGYLVGRGSLVIGDSRATFAEIQDDNDELDTDVTIIDTSIWVGEVQLGLEWARRFCIGDVFLRAALEAQCWHDGGHILEGGGEDSPHDDLTLLGFLLGGGIRR